MKTKNRKKNLLARQKDYDDMMLNNPPRHRSGWHRPGSSKK